MSFGPGGPAYPTDNTGNVVGVLGSFHPQWIIVPEGYVSGNPLSDSSTYGHETFASLGVTPGICVWTWGEGDHADSFTVRIGVPEPAGLLLLPLGLVGVVAARRYR